jgi:hypothetical protein
MHGTGHTHDSGLDGRRKLYFKASIAAVVVSGILSASSNIASAAAISTLSRADAKTVAAAVKECKPASPNINNVDFKENYKLGRIQKANQMWWFATVIAVVPADVAKAGLDPASRTEVNFYHIGGVPTGQLKSYSGDHGSVCQFVFAFPVAKSENAPVMAQAPAPIRKLGLLPERGKSSYMYVYRAPVGTQYITPNTDVSPASEIAFASTIPWSQVKSVYSVDYVGNAVALH